MDEIKFLQEYRKQKIFLEEWGKIVNGEISKKLLEKGIKLELFLKIPNVIRVKDDNSILNKAFYRDKNYKNPLEDITDKVGIRFVVLLLEDIKILEEIIEGSDLWGCSKDRDFEQERLKNPTIFDYQSVHYVVRSNSDLKNNDITIPKGTTCEVQIRTLLQHAYSELTHDTVYKPKRSADPNVHRLVARSMAMIETTDTIFEEVNEVMNLQNKKIIDVLQPMIESEYAKICESEAEYDKGITEIILDSYSKEIEQISLEALEKFFDKKKNTLKNQINSKYKSYLLFRQPIILLIFFFS